MIVPDANILLYAYYSRSDRYEASRRWLETTLDGTEVVAFTWLTTWAFLRISTSPRIFTYPLTAAEATAAVSSWLERPQVAIIEPGEKHWEILQRFLREGQSIGPLAMDAALAALVVEHGATLYTTDRDFSRFEGLSWRNPLVGDSPRE
jgi:toxin-antitoxin system PIN domain toxin